MIFGDPNKIAIEVYVDKKFVSTGVWGQLNIWLNGKQLGDKEGNFGCIAPVVNSSNSLLHNFDKLWNKKLEGISDTKIYELLDYHLYGHRGHVEVDDCKEIDEFLGDAEYWQHNFLTNWGEFFDSEPKHFIYGKRDNIIILRLDYSDSELGEVITSIIPFISFKEVFSEFVDWYYQPDVINTQPLHLQGPGDKTPPGL